LGAFVTLPADWAIFPAFLVSVTWVCWGASWALVFSVPKSRFSTETAKPLA
jgi:hypothetical protein